MGSCPGVVTFRLDLFDRRPLQNDKSCFTRRNPLRRDCTPRACIVLPFFFRIVVQCEESAVFVRTSSSGEQDSGRAVFPTKRLIQKSIAGFLRSSPPTRIAAETAAAYFDVCMRRSRRYFGDCVS